MRTKKQTANLLLLADFLEKVPRKRFDFSSWVGNDWKGMADLSCGTTACGLGWGTTMPELRKQGLRLGQTEMGIGVPVLQEDVSKLLTIETWTTTWELTTKACKKIFGLSDVEVEYLFTPGDRWDSRDKRLPESATPKRLAKHIRDFVEHGFKKGHAHTDIPGRSLP